ncbi:hypothetical protein BV898_02146 [Hypsibius exemplaris]|uniref:Uncharacterized protein n=1 Tax=Hypsibius exemplaris TaxID=2072580 RepID=A0A1W0X9I5_HYPEX|nr:hypothetical protein BV898_02146 [Hypsibius exemplaris]
MGTVTSFECEDFHCSGKVSDSAKTTIYFYNKITSYSTFRAQVAGGCVAVLVTLVGMLGSLHRIFRYQFLLGSDWWQLDDTVFNMDIKRGRSRRSLLYTSVMSLSRWAPKNPYTIIFVGLL